MSEMSGRSLRLCTGAPAAALCGCPTAVPIARAASRSARFISTGPLQSRPKGAKAGATMPRRAAGSNRAPTAGLPLGLRLGLRLVSPDALRYRAATFSRRNITRAQTAEDGPMKPELQPHYHTINVVMTDDNKFTTRSTWGKEGDTLHLDIDPKSHPAWTGGQQQLVDRGGRLSRFQKKFAGIGLKK